MEERKPRAKKNGITRERVIDCAFEELKENGWECWNARQIARRAGCSTMPIFRLFGSMDELKKEVIARALTDEAFRTRLEQDPRETIETELQCKVSGDVTFKVREEENPGEMTILLPKLPKKEMGEQLTDREIDDIVAAGNIGIAVGIVTTDIVLVKGIA